MSEAEERFLTLPDANDYTRVRQFNIDAKGAVIARGDSFRRKRQQQQQTVHAQRSNPLARSGGDAAGQEPQNGKASEMRESAPPPRDGSGIYFGNYFFGPMATFR